MLRHKAASGFFWLTIGSGSQQLISFLVFIFLTWRLAPEDFGIVAFAAVFVELLTILACFGQLEVIQQRAAARALRASTSFWLIQVLAVIATAGLLLAAPALAVWMRTPGLDTYLLLLSPAILLTTLGHVHEGLIRREMRYRPLAVRNVAATTMSGLAAVAAVLAGQPELALVVQKLGFAMTMTLVLWIACPWRPRLRVSLLVARWLLPRGFHVMAANVSSQLNMRILDFVVGLWLGTYWLGQLKIAWRIFDFVAQVAIAPVASVALSLFPQSASTPQRLAASFTETLKVLALVSFPVFFGLSALAPELTVLVLGPKWADAAILIQLLAVLSLAAVVNYLYAPLLIAAGRTGQVFAQGLLQNALTAVLAVAAVGFGAFAVMLAHVARAYLLAAVNLYTVKRAVGLSVTRVLGVMAPPAVASAAMAALVVAASPALAAETGAHAGLALSVLTGVAVYGAVLIAGDLLGLWPDYVRGTLMDLRSALRSVRKPHSLREAAE